MGATMTRRMRRREMVSHQWRWRGWLGAAATVLTCKGVKMMIHVQRVKMMMQTMGILL